MKTVHITAYWFEKKFMYLLVTYSPKEPSLQFQSSDMEVYIFVYVSLTLRFSFHHSLLISAFLSFTKMYVLYKLTFFF